MNNNKGFTLIEMIMVITLLGIVAAIIAIPLLQGVKGWFDATTREGITQSGRIGIERMTREIRNTARVDSVTALCAVPPCPCISSATATSFSFSDISSGDTTLCNFITFSWAGAGNPIMLGADTLADNVNSLTIKYYKSDNSWINEDPISAANRLLIRRLSIEIVSTKGGETLQKYNEVYLSNMRGY